MTTKTLRLFHADSPQYLEAAERLFREYHEWLDGETAERYGEELDLCGLHAARPAESDDYQPPHGRLVLAECDGAIAGIGALRPLEVGIAEIKHMYVWPEHRGRGVARKLLERLLDDAREIGYSRIRLDSTEFMTAAHELYRSVGFREIEPYGEHAPFASMLLFMELDLRAER